MSNNDTVIEAEVINPDELRDERAREEAEAKKEHRVDLIDQGADVLESAADVAGYVSRDAEQAIREKAAQVRRVGDTVAVAAENGRKFMSTVGRLADKLGVTDRIAFVSRDLNRGAR